MISAEFLRKLGATSSDQRFFNFDFDYMFDIRSQELWETNDGIGEPVFLAKITNTDKLITILQALDILS